MLIVDIYTLKFVNALYFLKEVLVYALNSVESQNVVRIQRSSGDVFTGIYLVADLDVDSCSVRNNVYSVLISFLDGNFRLVVLSGFDGDNFTVAFADLSKSLRLTSFKKLFNSRKTLSDVSAGNTAGVEGSHGELSTGFTDGLSSDDTYGLADVDLFTCSQVSAVALSADTCLGVAGHD